MDAKIYTVTGKTCAIASTRSVPRSSSFPGVDVQVDLASGSVTVISEQPLDDAAVAAAVDKAGYAVAS